MKKIRFFSKYFLMCYASCVVLLGSIPSLPDLIQNQPETTLNCMALALHTVSLSLSCVCVHFYSVCVYVHFYVYSIFCVCMSISMYSVCVHFYSLCVCRFYRQCWSLKTGQKRGREREKERRVKMSRFSFPHIPSPDSTSGRTKNNKSQQNYFRLPNKILQAVQL